MRLFDVLNRWIERRQGDGVKAVEEKARIVELKATAIIVTSWWSTDAASRLAEAADKAAERLRQL